MREQRKGLPCGEDAGWKDFDDSLPLEEVSPADVRFAAEESAELLAGEGFHGRLLELIRRSGLRDAEIYGRAGMDRRLYWKICDDRTRLPRKNTILLLALALRLSLEETVDLLRLSGRALSPASRSDLIVEYCLRHGIYDLRDVNTLLGEAGQEPL